MPTDTFVQNFVISKISRSKFEELSSSGMLNENEFYLIEDPQIDAGNQPIVNVSAPSSGTDAANKDYVDGASSAIAADIATLSSAMSSKADQSAFNEFASTTSDSLSALGTNKANLDSPTFTGTPTAPTASSGTSSTQIATTAFVQTAVASVDVSQQIAGKLNSDAVADVFSESSTYAVGSIVVYNGERYKCISEVQTADSWTGDSNWSRETVQEAINGINVSSQIKGKMDANSVSNAWSDIAAYSVGDVVEYEGALYKCNTAIAAASSDSSNSWDSSLWDSTSVDIVSKLEQDAVAPVFNGASTYFANDYVTYNGVLYKCVNAKTTASNITPENDIYNASSASANHWQEVDMTSPDATVDIMTGGTLRVVAADGTILWMQGYDLGSASSLSGASMTLDNEALNTYNFVVNSTDQISLALPTAPSGKVGDFIIDIYNPPIGDAFSESSTYSSGTQAFYNGDLYSCTTAVETAGAWTGSTNWALVASAFNSSSDYSSGTNVVYDDAIWKCQTSSVAAGAWTGTDDWQTASFIIPQWENNTIGIVVPIGEDLQDMLTFAPGTMCELYFTQTAFNVGSKPTWKVVRQDVESGGAS